MNYPQPPPPNWQPPSPPPFVPAVASKPKKTEPPKRGVGIGLILVIAVISVVAIAGLVIGMDELRLWNLKRHIGNELQNFGDNIDKNLTDWNREQADECDKQVAEIVAAAKAGGRGLTPAESAEFAALRDRAKEYRAEAAKIAAKQAIKSK